MKWDQSQIGIEIDSYYKLHEERIESSVQNREKTHFENLLRKRRRDSLWISIGGPLQTMLTGTVGFLWVWYKKNKASSRFNLWYLTSVLLALFWLRQIANLSLSTFKGIWSGDYFGGDEERISILLGLWPGTISINNCGNRLAGLSNCNIQILAYKYKTALSLRRNGWRNTGVPNLDEMDRTYCPALIISNIKAKTQPIPSFFVSCPHGLSEQGNTKVRESGAHCAPGGRGFYHGIA